MSHPTLFLPLSGSSSFPDSPSFLLPSNDPAGQVSKLIKAVIKAKRIVIVCGAGISVQAGIPDFRSPDGLFQSLKRSNPKEALSSGKDLFDASVFNSEHTTTLFYRMIAQLSSLSSAASPTPFHHLLRTLDRSGKLLRIYTQNIDAIEVKSGLSFGIPQFDARRKTRIPSPPEAIPRCIPLHGTLQKMHCQTCNHSVSLAHHLPSLTCGIAPECPECTAMEETRQLVGKRARGVGRLRPSVVLYNEAHKDGEGVGEVVRKDLLGTSKGKGRNGADLLLVVGTSLRVPGTKRIVREFAKAVRSRRSASSSQEGSPFGSPTPASDEEPATLKSIYLNLDFPVPTREWEGVFDVWVQGDAQNFAERLSAEIQREMKAKEAARERRMKREEEAALAMEREHAELDRKRKAAILKTPTKPAKRRKVDPGSTLLSPAKTPTKRKPPSNRLKPDPPPEHKIILRIPARPRPEVLIIRAPPKPPRPHKFITPLTPPATPRRPPVLAIEGEEEGEGGGKGVLPTSFLRTVQYGLRGCQG